jgi:hypothetical protein
VKDCSNWRPSLSTHSSRISQALVKLRHHSTVRYRPRKSNTGPLVVAIQKFIYNGITTYRKFYISRYNRRNTRCCRPRDRKLTIYVHLLSPNRIFESMSITVSVPYFYFKVAMGFFLTQLCSSVSF